MFAHAHSRVSVWTTDHMAGRVLCVRMAADEGRLWAGPSILAAAVYNWNTQVLRLPGFPPNMSGVSVSFVASQRS